MWLLLVWVLGFVGVCGAIILVLVVVVINLGALGLQGLDFGFRVFCCLALVDSI